MKLFFAFLLKKRYYGVEISPYASTQILSSKTLFIERSSVGTILTDNLTPGMLLTADVHDRNGRLLLGAGTELTDKHIYIFRTWGVIEADIMGIEEDSDSNPFTNVIDPDVWAAAEAEIKPLFRHTDLTHPVINQLLYLGIMRKVQHGPR